jgi:hypothetical protein
MREGKMEEQNTKREYAKSKKRVWIIIACLACAFLLCGIMIAIVEGYESGEGEFETWGAIDPLKLHETYDEDFDIMEYDEYLGFDRNIYLDDRQTGVKESVAQEQASLHGKAFEVVYFVLRAINEGDSETYNAYMGKDALKKGEFTQQQIYDITISPHSSSEDGGIEEYIFKVTYKIHENNGTYRNTIESDTSRPQYFYVNNSTGEFLVAKILEPAGKK